VTAQVANPVQYRWELWTHTVIGRGKATRGRLVIETTTASDRVTFTAPPPGVYRLYVYVEDPVAQAAGYASWPFLTS
jgi:hypothetical protein